MHAEFSSSPGTHALGGSVLAARLSADQLERVAALGTATRHAPGEIVLREGQPSDRLFLVDEGRISPVPSEAWDFHVGGVRVLEEWFTRRTEPAEPGTLEVIRPTAWPQPWTSELLELITVLALLAEVRPKQAELTAGDPITTADLRRAGVLPVPDSCRRPASVLDHREEGPEGQFTLL